MTETVGAEVAIAQPDQSRSISPATEVEQRGPEITRPTRAMKTIGVVGAAVATTLLGAAAIAEARGYHVSTLIQHAADFFSPTGVDHLPNPQPGPPPVPPG